MDKALSTAAAEASWGLLLKHTYLKSTVLKQAAPEGILEGKFYLGKYLLQQLPWQLTLSRCCRKASFFTLQGLDIL